MANPDKITILLGSDGSQQEGNDAEAARLAVAQQLNVKLFIDDNDVTIAGHPSDYFKGFSVEKVRRSAKLIGLSGADPAFPIRHSEDTVSRSSTPSVRISTRFSPP